VFDTLPHLTHRARSHCSLPPTRDQWRGVFVDYAHTPTPSPQHFRRCGPHVMGVWWRSWGQAADRDRAKRPLMDKPLRPIQIWLFCGPMTIRAPEDPASIRHAVDARRSRTPPKSADRAEAILRGNRRDWRRRRAADRGARRHGKRTKPSGTIVLPFDDVEQARSLSRRWMGDCMSLMDSKRS